MKNMTAMIKNRINEKELDEKYITEFFLDNEHRFDIEVRIQKRMCTDNNN